MKIIKKIKNILLNERFIKKYNLPKSKIVEELSSQTFKDSVVHLINANDYNTNSVFNVFKPLLITIGMPKEKQLEYIYQYTLNKSFPEATLITLKNEYDGACELFLRSYRIFCTIEKEMDLETWQSKYPLNLLTYNEIKGLEDPTEYVIFKKAYEDDYVYELMKMNQEIIGYTTLNHVSGVHYLSMYLARQINQSDVPIDLGVVSGAAAGHDIGKFGCKKHEQHKVPYYHYYYTGQWFERKNIEYIRNIALNHSTWDLELDNLSIESLILIYCDFRVKTRYESGKEYMHFYSLKAAFDVILNKLDNVDEAKEKRYRRVYAKLKDFEDYLIHLGIDIEIKEDAPRYISSQERLHYALMSGNEIIDQVKNISINYNINVMHSLRTLDSLNKILENARATKNLSDLRSYINVFDDYSTYLTQNQKRVTIEFLYEEIVCSEQDIRRHCAELIGKLIANFDEKSTKELPECARDTIEEKSNHLFEEYLEKFLYPDDKYIVIHQRWLRYSLRSMIRTLYFFDEMTEAKEKILMDHIKNNTNLDIYLLQMIEVIDFNRASRQLVDRVIEFVCQTIRSDDLEVRLKTKLIILKTLDVIDSSILREEVSRIYGTLTRVSDSAAENYIDFKLCNEVLNDIPHMYYEKLELDLKNKSEIFLSNLKSATPAISKKIHIEMFTNQKLIDFEYNIFYTAMHLCNLLKVSSIKKTRDAAGRSLVKLVPFLNLEERNDIVIELLRALEIENFEFTRYIPEYLGEIILTLQPTEFDEIIEDFSIKIKNSTPKTSTLILKTIGVTISHYSYYFKKFDESGKDYYKRLIKMLGILFNGFVNENSIVSQTAFLAIGKEIFERSSMTLMQKKKIFELMIKKLISVMVNTNAENELVFFNNSAGMKHIYRFIADFNFFIEPLTIKSDKKIAFFPGSFDPFSASHKKIATSIRDLGYEVFLAVDEFSWSKQTQPNLIRRDIIKVSVADEIDIYTYPRDISINIACNKDLKALKESFSNKDVKLVVGSDVVLNASAYRKPVKEHSIHSLHHIIFKRDQSVDDSELLDQIENLNIQATIVKLPPRYEHISSTQIRDYIDRERDISKLVDPMAQKFILKEGLYQREPQYKEAMTTKSIIVEERDTIDTMLLEELSRVVEYDYATVASRLKQKSQEDGFKILILRNLNDNRRIIAFAVGHWLRSKNIYYEFSDSSLCDYIRSHSTGRLLVIDGIYVSNDNVHVRSVEQMILTELLAKYLEDDYSYAIYKDMFNKTSDQMIIKTLLLQGFISKQSDCGKEKIYVTNMSNPCTLNLDCTSTLKQPFRSNDNVRKAIYKARKRLQRALTDLYPGNLVLSFNRTMLYENLIKKICDINNMPTTKLEPRQLGENICVPYGSIFNRWILPNTVTKSLHTERLFEPDLGKRIIEAYPNYLDINDQMKMIKSYNKPVILVDDLLNKGYRIKALDPMLKKHDIQVSKILVGILSGRGKALMNEQGRDVDAAYFLPKLKVWFNEALMYPFIGGDGLNSGKMVRNLITSINLILPYTSAKYIQGTSNKNVFNLSKTCLENALHIMETLEHEYQLLHGRILTLSKLAEVIVYPRVPDKGKYMYYDLNEKPSTYIKNDLIRLMRLKEIYYRGC